MYNAKMMVGIMNWSAQNADAMQMASHLQMPGLSGKLSSHLMRSAAEGGRAWRQIQTPPSLASKDASGWLRFDRAALRGAGFQGVRSLLSDWLGR